jgi:hypothetical protein
VSTVCASSLLWCLVDLDVGNNEVGSIKTLNVSVGDGVLEETEKELGGLLWPASLGGTELLSYSTVSVDIPSCSISSGYAEAVDFTNLGQFFQ